MTGSDYSLTLYNSLAGQSPLAALAFGAIRADCCARVSYAADNGWARKAIWASTDVPASSPTGRGVLSPFGVDGCISGTMFRRCLPGSGDVGGIAGEPGPCGSCGTASGEAGPVPASQAITSAGKPSRGSDKVASSASDRGTGSGGPRFVDAGSVEAGCVDGRSDGAGSDGAGSTGAGPVGTGSAGSGSAFVETGAVVCRGRVSAAAVASTSAIT